MEKKQTISTKRIAMTALMAALTVVGSGLRITVPLELTGTTSFHLGNILCALSGILLGPWLGGLAAGLGSFLYDMTNPTYMKEAWITFLTKGAYGLAAGAVARSGKKPWGFGKALAGTLTGAVLYAILYLCKDYFYDGLLFGGLTADAALLSVLPKLPATAFNAFVAILFAPPLAIAIRKGLEQNRLSLN